MTSAKCAHCGEDCKLVEGSIVYPHRRDLYELFFWVCDPCMARVGCHKKGALTHGKKSDGTIPLGTAANKRLRDARMAIHRKVDPIWQQAERKSRTRKDVYAILTSFGKIHGFVEPRQSYHTGSLSLYQCSLLNTHWSSIESAIKTRIQSVKEYTCAHSE